MLCSYVYCSQISLDQTSANNIALIFTTGKWNLKKKISHDGPLAFVICNMYVSTSWGHMIEVLRRVQIYKDILLSHNTNFTSTRFTFYILVDYVKHKSLENCEDLKARSQH